MVRKDKNNITSAGRYQDGFDRAFIQIIDELQKKGFCKNIKALERFLQIPRNTFYQVLNGSRGLPLKHRDVILKFFTSRYNVNPLFFNNRTTALYKDMEPIMEDVDEEYLITPNKTHSITSGDMKVLGVLKLENERLAQMVKDRDSLIINLTREIKTLQRLVDILGKEK